MRKWGILTGILFLAWMSSFAQGGKIRRGDSFYEEQVYVKALHLYEEAYPRARSNNDLLRKMVDAAYRVGENESALKYGKLLIARKKAEPLDLLIYAKALKRSGNYEEAAHWLAEYNKFRSDSLGQQVGLQLDYINELLRDSLAFSVQPVNVNTHRAEMGPVVYGDSLVFCSAGRRSGPRRKSYLDQEPYLKLFVAEILPDGQLDKPMVFAPNIRTKFHDGPVTIAQSAGKLFMTQNQKTRLVNFRFENFVQLKIQQAVLQEGQWQPDGEFSFNGKKYSVAHPALNDDGTILVFASNQKGGFGNADLYISYFSDGNWSEPENLGPEVNTPESELFPYLASDNNLYFSSTGLEGLGGLDLFKAELVNGQGRNVENLGAPINSSSDDFSFAFTEPGNKGYFASNRRASRNDDLYYFERIVSPFPEPLIVLNVEDKLDTTQASGEDNTESGIVKQPVMQDGDWCIEAGEFVALDTEADTNDAFSAEVEDGEPMQVLQVQIIYYDLAKSDFPKDASAIFDPLIDLLTRHSDLELRIESHADCRGTRNANKILSEKRAKIIRNYFVSRYINADRIRSEGFGENRPVNSCGDEVNCTEEEHAANRRSVLKIVRKGEFAAERL